MNSILQIPNTLELLCACWNKAETILQHDIKNNCPDIDEEAITQNFYARFSESLRSASEAGKIEFAFLEDLQTSFASWCYGYEIDLQKIASGLIADVTLHRRETERVTGGDFGFMIIRPYISLGYSSLHISDYRRGILIQAKLKRPKGWGAFTPNQEKIIPQRLEYLALLLYSYSDDERRNLDRFRWQLCNGISLNALKGSLRKEDFQGSLDSCEMIHGLGNATIGTDNETIIDKFVSPQKSPSLVIRIFWPDGGHPGSEVLVYSRQEVELKAEVLVRHWIR